MMWWPLSGEGFAAQLGVARQWCRTPSRGVPPVNAAQPPALATRKPLPMHRREMISPRGPGGILRPQPTVFASASAQGSFSNSTPVAPSAPFLPPPRQAQAASQCRNPNKLKPPAWVGRRC
ncbi:hypothetical protein TraAM80_10435 [Trypanosoma rangeli]|uniref:Uncharacterized protein n=1 Tax=Trypanosoma rangeli TaxID=5698 RepID=A0A422MPB1_TRYRA|nr:uncharacterized protein TraAM80_10435 [Trypanosoma rangeli]RNE95059.1 hypothetical protein TraAM80_10435 [Trypanosoma rangeli]|eukprot:RNE95059.1 hypothetical protein TraAM80_10435 [Trypanosoma rangeli]